MKRPEDVKREFVHQWLRKAHDDLATARHLANERGEFGFAIGFHAQQAAEKLIKAFLVWHQIEFSKTHDLEVLASLVTAVSPELAARVRQAAVLTIYAVDTRYPGDLPEPTAAEANDAIALADQLSVAIRSLLPEDFR
jgi:HEPN domain-containing protein